MKGVFVAPKLVTATVVDVLGKSTKTHIIVDRPGASDRIRLLVEGASPYQLEPLADALKSAIGIRFEVEIAPEGSLVATEAVSDERRL